MRRGGTPRVRACRAFRAFRACVRACVLVAARHLAHVECDLAAVSLGLPLREVGGYEVREAHQLPQAPHAAPHRVDRACARRRRLRRCPRLLLRVAPRRRLRLRLRLQLVARRHCLLLRGGLLAPRRLPLARLRPRLRACAHAARASRQLAQVPHDVPPRPQQLLRTWMSLISTRVCTTPMQMHTHTHMHMHMHMCMCMCMCCACHVRMHMHTHMHTHMHVISPASAPPRPAPPPPPPPPPPYVAASLPRPPRTRRAARSPTHACMHACIPRVCMHVHMHVHALVGLRRARAPASSARCAPRRPRPRAGQRGGRRRRGGPGEGV